MEANVEPWDYIDENDGKELQGFFSIPEGKGPFPSIVILPDWDGVNHYEKVRATMAAQDMGYFAFAADIYGKDLHNVDDFEKRIELSTMYRSNPSLFIGRIQAAVDQVMDGLDGSFMIMEDKIALIGYCFGGTGSLMYALSDKDDVLAVVSVHGGLMPFEINTEALSPRVLVLSGGDDDTYTDVSVLEDTLDAAGNTWEITRYSDVEHGFTNFDSDLYNEFVDHRVWDSTTTWLSELFGGDKYGSNEPDSFNVIPIDYEDVEGNNTVQLRGYLSLPENPIHDGPLPLVVVFPGGSGVTDYEKKRATMLADLGYIAFAADIYGAESQDIPDDSKFELISKFLKNEPLYIQRMQRAIDVASTTGFADVDTENVGIIGYCFGGSGVVIYARSGSDSAKVAVAFHGTFYDEEVPVLSDTITPYTLILSGGDDPLYKDQNHLEDALNKGNADWEITMYSDIGHGFTFWGDPKSYNALADTRSWNSMKEVFEEVFFPDDHNHNIFA